MQSQTEESNRGIAARDKQSREDEHGRKEDDTPRERIAYGNGRPTIRGGRWWRQRRWTEREQSLRAGGNRVVRGGGREHRRARSETRKDMKRDDRQDDRFSKRGARRHASAKIYQCGRRGSTRRESEARGTAKADSGDYRRVREQTGDNRP